MVTTSKIRDWMDKQIEASKLQNEVLVVNDDEGTLTNLSRTSKIHLVGEAVRFISEELDIPMYVKARKNDTDYPYEIAVLYEGYMFFALESESEYKERGAVV